MKSSQFGFERPLNHELASNLSSVYLTEVSRSEVNRNNLDFSQFSKGPSTVRPSKISWKVLGYSARIFFSPMAMNKTSRVSSFDPPSLREALMWTLMHFSSPALAAAAMVTSSAVQASRLSGRRALKSFESPSESPLARSLRSPGTFRSDRAFPASSLSAPLADDQAYPGILSPKLIRILNIIDSGLGGFPLGAAPPPSPSASRRR